MYSGYYGTFIAHLFSLISSIWSIFEVQKCKIPTSIQKLLFTSLLTVFFNSILSLLRYGLADGYKLRKFHVVSLNISTIFFLTLISYALQLVAKLSMLWVCFPILNIIPFYRNVSKLDYRSKRKGSDIIVVLNCLIFLYAAIYSENFYAIAFILSFGFGYVYVGDCGYFLDTEVPSIDIYQYVQCFLCLFTSLVISTPFGDGAIKWVKEFTLGISRKMNVLTIWTKRGRKFTNLKLAQRSKAMKELILQSSGFA